MVFLLEKTVSRCLMFLLFSFHEERVIQHIHIVELFTNTNVEGLKSWTKSSQGKTHHYFLCVQV